MIMPQIQFLRGKYENLKKLPLSDGSIYFTEDTRRLFVDTATERIPVAGDSICGKIFWVKLLATGWTNNEQVVTQYYEVKDGNNYPINELLTDDSIIFIGKSTFGTSSADGIFPAIISNKSDKDSITFSLYQIPATDDGTTIEIQVPTEDVWVQIYCPNPAIAAFEKVEAFKTVFTSRLYLQANSNWILYTDGKRYYQDIHIPNIVFSQMPYLLNLSDDSLENREEYLEIEFEEFDCEEHPNKKDILRFFMNKQPNFNIAIDICIVIADGGSTDDRTKNEWIKVEVGKQTSLIENYIEVDTPGLADIPEGETRQFLVYCADKNLGYSDVKNITYSPESKKIKITFKDGVTAIKETFTCYIIQLNNIAKIYEAKLIGGEREIDIENKKDGWYPDISKVNIDTIDENNTYYWQIWPDPDSDTRLQLKHLPIIYPKDKDKAIDFSKIIETKIYNNQIQFWTKEVIENDLDIIIVDWL